MPGAPGKPPKSTAGPGLPATNVQMATFKKGKDVVLNEVVPTPMAACIYMKFFYEVPPPESGYKPTKAHLSEKIRRSALTNNI